MTASTGKKMPLEKLKTLTHVFRVSFPQVFEAKSFAEQKPKYSVTMLFEKDVDLSAPAAEGFISLKRAALNAAIEKWGPKDQWSPKIKSKLRMPFRDGDTDRPDTPGYEGCIFVVATSVQRPGLWDLKYRPITDAEEFYAGCYARAEVIAKAYDEAGNIGVSFYLQNIQKVKEGEAFSGRSSDPTSIFPNNIDADDDEEELEADDDEEQLEAELEADDDEEEDDEDEEVKKPTTSKTKKTAQTASSKKSDKKPTTSKLKKRKTELDDLAW